MEAMVVLMLGLVVWLLWLVIRLRSEAWVNRRVIASLQKVRPVTEQKIAWASPVLLRLSLQSVACIGMLLLIALLFFLLPVAN